VGGASVSADVSAGISAVVIGDYNARSDRAGLSDAFLAFYSVTASPAGGSLSLLLQRK
jgi:hypothetical protein